MRPPRSPPRLPPLRRAVSARVRRGDRVAVRRALARSLGPDVALPATASGHARVHHRAVRRPPLSRRPPDAGDVAGGARARPRLRPLLGAPEGSTVLEDDAAVRRQRPAGAAVPQTALAVRVRSVLTVAVSVDV